MHQYRHGAVSSTLLAPRGGRGQDVHGHRLGHENAAAGALQKGHGDGAEPSRAAVGGGMAETLPERTHSRRDEGGLGKGQPQEVRIQSRARRLGRRIIIAQSSSFAKIPISAGAAGRKAARGDRKRWRPPLKSSGKRAARRAVRSRTWSASKSQSWRSSKS